MRAPWFITGFIFLAAVATPFLQPILRGIDRLADSAFGVIFVGTAIMVVLGALAFNLLRIIKEWIWKQ